MTEGRRVHRKNHTWADSKLYVDSLRNAEGASAGEQHPKSNPAQPNPTRSSATSRTRLVVHCQRHGIFSALALSLRFAVVKVSTFENWTKRGCGTDAFHTYIHYGCIQFLHGMIRATPVRCAIRVAPFGFHLKMIVYPPRAWGVAAAALNALRSRRIAATPAGDCFVITAVHQNTRKYRLRTD